MEINQHLTKNNYNAGTAGRIQYIVIHYTANNGDTAYNNTVYFQAYRGASAHYFVDENDIWQSIEDNNIAWHCGAAGAYRHPECRNSNSIGIELCSRISNGRYYFKEETVSNAVTLTRYLMELYNIPVENVLRHYDVTGKICPEPFVRDNSLWNDFLLRLCEPIQEEEMAEKRYNTIGEIEAANIAADAVRALEAAIAKGKKENMNNLNLPGGIFADANNMNLSRDMIIAIIYNYRAGLYN